MEHSDSTPPESTGDVTRILHALGDHAPSDGAEKVPPLSVERLRDVLYEELRRIAASRQGSDRDLRHTTSIANEIYLRLMKSGIRWENRRHFFGAAAIAMRRLLVDDARRRRAHKRGGEATHLPLPDHLEAVTCDPLELLALDEAIERLRDRDDRMAEVVNLRLFAGLSCAEIGEVLGVSERTASRDWEAGRIWLYRETHGSL